MDVHNILTESLLNRGLTAPGNTITAVPKSKGQPANEIYSLVSFFTSRYLDFIVIDLKQDLYYLYKLHTDDIDAAIPLCESYSRTSAKVFDKFFSRVNDSRMSELADIKKLASHLARRSSLEFSYSLKDGTMVKTVFSKIESEDGRPTKAVCYTIPDSQEKRLIVKTFGNFQVFDSNHQRIKFTRKKSEQLLAYLIDKHGYPSSTRDVIIDVLEKDPDDLNAAKYVSTISRQLIKDLEEQGYHDVVRKQYNSLYIHTDAVDCDYYSLLNGDLSIWKDYHNEYMKEYSWAESTNAELMHYFAK